MPSKAVTVAVCLAFANLLFMHEMFCNYILGIDLDMSTQLDVVAENKLDLHIKPKATKKFNTFQATV